MSYTQTIADKRQADSEAKIQSHAEQQLLRELRNIKQAVLTTAHQEHTVKLEKDRSLETSMDNLSAKVVAAVESIDGKAIGAEQITAIRELKQAFEKFQAENIDGYAKIAEQQEKFIQALQAIEMKPVVNVPEARVSVPKPHVEVVTQTVDLKPLQETIREVMTPTVTEDIPVLIDRFDLSRYHAQDLKDGQDIQYVGLVNPEGNWCIIENDIKSNKMRYVFGSGQYSKHFKACTTFKYLILDKAINAAS